MSNQPVRAQQYIFYITLVSRSTGQWQVNPTIAAGDFQVSKDGAAYANLGTLPAVEPAGSDTVKVTLSAAEMSCNNLNFRGKDVSGAEWDDVFSNIQPISWINPNDFVLANVIQWASGTIVSPNLTGIPKVDLVDIDGLATNGNNATLNLKQLNVNNSAGDAIVAVGGGISGNGVNISGADNGLQVSGNIGGAILAYTNALNGSAVNIFGDGTGKSINASNDISVSDGDLTLTAIAKKILTLDWTSVTGEAARSVLNALRKLRNKVSFNGTDTLTVYKEDGTTSAYTQSVTEDANQDPFKELGN